MRASRILALSSLAVLICVFLAACGGGGSAKPPAGPPSITSSVLPQASVNVPYSFYLQGAGGTGMYTWSISAGSLPPGLTLDGTTAQISGTVPSETNGQPTMLGKYSFTAKVTDASNLTGTANLSLLVGGALLIDCNSCISGSTTLPSGSPGVPYSAMLTVSGGVAPYSWCVLNMGGTACDPTQSQLPPGLTLTTDSNGDGIISGTPTSVPAVPPTFSLQVNDSEVPSASSTVQLKITIIGILTPSLPPGTLNVPYSQTMTVSGGLIPYSWSISKGSLPPGLGLQGNCLESRQPNCTISGTPTLAGNYPFTVEVKDGEPPPYTATATAQFVIVVQGVSNALLTGNYAFTLNGYDNGKPFVMAGAFVANGNGGIIKGFLDLNDGSGEQIDSHGNVLAQIISPSSTYNLNPNGTGTLTIVTSKPATYQFSVMVVSSACSTGPNISTCGQLIESDPSNPQLYGSGVLKVQDAAYFQVSAFFPGNFALQATGTDPNGNRYAAAGALGTNPTTLVDIDCSGNGWGLTNGCPLDIDDNGLVPSAGDPLKGTFSSTVDGSSGRGNFVDLTFPTDPSGICLGKGSSPTCHYAYYIVDHAEMIMISADPVSYPANLTLWRANRQASSVGGWTLTALTNSGVMELNAVDPNGGKAVADLTTGFLVSNGAGDATLNTDENDGGTLKLLQTSQGTYAIDSEGQKTGRVTFTGFTAQFDAAPPVLYLFGSNFAFVVGTDAKVTSGVLEPQSGSPFTNKSVANIYAGGSVSPVLTAVTNSVTDLIANGVGGVMAIQNTSGPGGPSGPNDLTLTYSVDKTGRAVVLTSQGQRYGSLYVVSPTKFILLPVGTAPALGIFSSAPGF
jgi:hypothetical protein